MLNIESQKMRDLMHLADCNEASIMHLFANDGLRFYYDFPSSIDIWSFNQNGKSLLEDVRLTSTSFWN